MKIFIWLILGNQGKRWQEVGMQLALSVSSAIQLLVFSHSQRSGLPSTSCVSTAPLLVPEHNFNKATTHNPLQCMHPKLWRTGHSRETQQSLISKWLQNENKAAAFLEYGHCNSPHLQVGRENCVFMLLQRTQEYILGTVSPDWKATICSCSAFIQVIVGSKFIYGNLPS